MILVWRTAGLREGFLSRGLTLACLKAEGKVPEVREELRIWRRKVMMEGEMV